MNILTIILPVYNGIPFLSDCVNSILSQSLFEFRFIVVNDGSEDQTLKLLKNISDPRLQILDKSHTGIIDSFNMALDLVDTKYVARIDVDDFYFTNKFQLQIEFLENNCDVCLVGTGGLYMSKIGKISKLRLNVPRNHEKIIKSLFLKGRGIIHSSIVVRTKILKQIGGYTPNIYPEDYELYFRIGRMGHLANLIDPLVAVRIHESYSHFNLESLLINYDHLISKYFTDYQKIYTDLKISNSENDSIIINRQGVYELLNGNKIGGLVKFAKSFRVNPKRFIKYFASILNQSTI